MARFNTVARGATKTKNHEGADAYALSAELELYSAVVTSILSNKFYENADMNTQRIQKLIAGIAKINPEFIGKLAVYAREKMYLRSIPLVLAVELAKAHSGDDLVGRVVSRIIQRPDEITEILAYYSKANKTTGTKKVAKLSKQIKRGVQAAFNKFDEYGFGKYDRDGEISLKDALFLTNPKPIDDEHKALFDKIAEGTLATPYTWEVELSKGGDKKETWEALIDSGKLGYMALLRNLRNILEAKVSKKHLSVVASRIADKEEVLRAKQFPFRFLSAYREIQDVTGTGVPMILEALEAAILASAENIAGFDDNVSILIASDVSGSMTSTVSERSKIQYYDIGLVLSMLLKNRCKDAETGIFGDSWKIKNFPRTNILSNVENMRDLAREVGMSTNGYLVLQDLIKRKDVKDKVMFFTDLQLWDSNVNWFQNKSQSDFQKLWAQYKKEIAPNAKLYLFDLAGYGQTPLTTKQGGVYLIAGWSDRIFEMLEAYDRGSSAIEEIEKISL